MLVILSSSESVESSSNPSIIELERAFRCSTFILRSIRRCLRATLRSSGSLCKRLAAPTFRRTAPGHGGGKPFLDDFTVHASPRDACPTLVRDAFVLCTGWVAPKRVNVMGLVMVSIATDPLARGADKVMPSVLVAERSLALVETCNRDFRSRNCIGNGDVKDFVGGTIWFADGNITPALDGTSPFDRLRFVRVPLKARSFCNRSRCMGAKESLGLSQSALTALEGER